MGLAMPNSALNQSARQKNVANMLATLRIEKLSPSESLKPSLQAYVDGQKTTTDLLNEVKAKSVALRRGWCLLHPGHGCSKEQSWNNRSRPAWWVWRWLHSYSPFGAHSRPSRGLFWLSASVQNSSVSFSGCLRLGGSSQERGHHQGRQSVLQRAPNPVLLEHRFQFPGIRKIFAQLRAQSFFKPFSPLLIRDQCDTSISRRQWASATTFYFTISWARRLLFEFFSFGSSYALPSDAGIISWRRTASIWTDF